MKIRMITAMAGPDGVAVPGQVISVSVETAQALISGGYAEAVHKIESVPETTTAEPPEKAIMPAPQRQEIKASNAAADLAAKHGIDLEEVEGTGAGGNITKPDIEKVIAELEGDGEE